MYIIHMSMLKVNKMLKQKDKVEMKTCSSGLFGTYFSGLFNPIPLFLWIIMGQLWPRKSGLGSSDFNEPTTMNSS